MRAPAPRRLAVILFAALSMLANLPVASGADVTNLRCEYRDNPLGIDAATPRLSWVIQSSKRGEMQTAYQVLAASTPELLAKDQGDLWDSGKVASDQSIQVAYGGALLASRQQCWWKVRVWLSQLSGSEGGGDHGTRLSWSNPAHFAMGLLSPEEWKARWIGFPENERAATSQTNYVLPILRKTFPAERKLKNATVFVCGLGQYELYLNGEKVGDNEYDPGWTNYKQTCLYTTYDITRNIRLGANTFGVILGNAFYNWEGGRKPETTRSFGPPKVILQLHLQYNDGSSACVVSDGEWKVARGPITFSDVYGGEDYDARIQHGWARPGFDDSAWLSAAVMSGPGGRLVSQSAPPVKVMQTFKPVKITEPSPGVYIYDFGQNCSGRPRITVAGPAGTQVKLTPEEVLGENGTLRQRPHFGPCSFSYILAGHGKETWAPRFSSFGFRYVQVEGASRERASGRPQVIAVELEHTRGSAGSNGQFSCSNDRFNRIHRLIDWALRSNMWSILTDCPHRERLGWLEEAHLMGPSLMYNYQVPLLLEKIGNDMGEAQLANGLVPDIAPEYVVFEGGFRDAPAWGSTSVILPWFFYQWYGDKSILHQHYGMMKRYVDYLTSKSVKGLVRHGLGDWCDVSGPGFSARTPLPAVESAIYYYDIAILEKAARLLGKAPDERRYAELAEQVRNAYNREFFHPETNQYATGTQAANAMPLALGIIQPDDRPAVLENIVKDIRAHRNHLAVGEVSHRFLIQALAENGRSDVLFNMTEQTDSPSYGRQLAKGMTSLAETWDAEFGNSMNHFMLGHIDEWFYRDLAGIQGDPEAPGFKQIIIKPAVVGDLTWVKGSYDSVQGRIVSNWKREGKKLSMDIVIPANTTATVSVPAQDAATVTESGRPADRAAGVKFLRRESNAAVYAVGSGTYRFQSTLPETIQ